MILSRHPRFFGGGIAEIGESWGSGGCAPHRGPEAEPLVRGSGAMDYHVSIGLHLTGYSAFDHCNHWIFDAAIDLAKTSWKGTSEVWGKPPPQKKKVPG